MKFIILVCLAAIAIAEAIDYCSKNCKKIKHIACKNKGKFKPNCPHNARLIDMAPHKDTIVKSHNEKRNLIASGKLHGFLPAARMATMQWDDELAFFATLNIKKCRLEHDHCQKTDHFYYPGQNLGATSYSGAESIFNDSCLIGAHINGWFSENRNTKMEYINKYPAKYSGRTIGHLTVMVIEKNTHVGCAAGRWKAKNSKMNTFHLACNYAAVNLVNLPVYKSSTKPASECETGTNPTYPSLCSIDEKY